MKIKDYPDYSIESTGKIWSHKRAIPRLLKQCDAGKGYLIVALFNDNGKQFVSVHRIVAQHFLPNPLNLPNVCHKDDDPTNNDVSNLFWGTQKDNMEDK